MTVVTSPSVTHEVDRTILRRGATATVRVRAVLTIPPWVEVPVRDLPPGVAAGEGVICKPGMVATYTVRLMVPGETAFGGVVLSVRDTFFSHDIICRRLDTPHLRVFPTGILEAGRGVGIRGEETEVNRQAALAGQGVHGSRSYRAGDNPRQVDWIAPLKPLSSLY